MAFPTVLDLDANFGSWEDLVALSTTYGGGHDAAESRTGTAGGGANGKSEEEEDEVMKRVTKLEEEIASWEKVERESDEQLAQISSSLPNLLSSTLQSLQSIQEQARTLSLDRSGLLEQLEGLERELVGLVAEDEERIGSAEGDADMDPRAQSPEPQPSTTDTREPKPGVKPQTILSRLETFQARLESLRAGLRWTTVLEEVMRMSHTALHPLSPTIAPSSSSSNVGTNPKLPNFLLSFRTLHHTVSSLQATLPEGMALRELVRAVEGCCWEEMRRGLGVRLAQSLSSIGWPKPVDYASVPLVSRRAFERTFREMLLFQAEGEKLAATSPAVTADITASRLYPFDIMVESIDARFRFHFEGTRNTNRLDKPEWAFSHVMDIIFEQQDFVQDYLQPLLHRCGFGHADAKNELINALLPLPLKLLQHRFPHLIAHPALLAHTIYQTVQFDDGLRDAGFDINATWSAQRPSRRVARQSEWAGITEEVLKRDGWYTRWLEGEKQFAEDRYKAIMSSSDAGSLLQEDSRDQATAKSTIAASQLRLLLEQVTDRYTPLPNVEYKYPFLSTIQVPVLEDYVSKFATSLDAFENLASALLRVVPGALAGHASHGGLAMDPAKITTGTTGLGRLCKAWIGLRSMLDAMRKWDDDSVFVSLAAEIEARPQVRRPSDDYLFGPTIFTLLIDRFQSVATRAEDMIVKHVSGEVERDLRVHLTRRWDSPDLAQGATISLDAALMTPLTTLSTQLGHVAQAVNRSSLIKIYRGIVAHIANHITQRAVFAGWSKYTAVGGAELLEAVNAWIDASRIALGPTSGIQRVEGPWRPLLETAILLALPNAATAERPLTLSRAVNLAFGAETDEVRNVLELKELSEDQIRVVLRRRVDSGR